MKEMSQKENDEGRAAEATVFEPETYDCNSSIQELESPQLIENVESESVLIANDLRLRV